MRRVLHGGLVFDGTGAEPQRADVVIEDGRLVDIGLGLDADEGVDVSGRTLLPGLFDCHVHVLLPAFDLLRLLNTPKSLLYYHAAKHLGAMLDIGITSVRDAAGADRGVRDAVAMGLVRGPRMQISVEMISQTGGHGDGCMPSGFSWTHSPLVDGVDEMRRRVRELVRDGADVIKIATTGGVLSPNDNPRHAHFRDDELRVAVEEARAAGLEVMAHAQGEAGIKSALRAGVRSIEHGFYLDDEAISLFLETGAYLVPTLVAPRAILDAAARGLAIPEQSVRKAREVVTAHEDSFRKAVEAGVRIAMGTDSGVAPHGQNLRELELMAQNGMAPLEVLRSTTSEAARLLGVDQERGRLAPGFMADIVVVEGVVTDLSGLDRRVEQVYLGGAPMLADRELSPA